MSLVEQELLTLPEHLSSPPVFSGVRVTLWFYIYICLVDRCLSFCTFSFGHCVVCSTSIYGLWLPLWYLQTLLNHFENTLVQTKFGFIVCHVFNNVNIDVIPSANKGNNKITELRTILQRESQNS